jgi:glutathione synthase/RimK-type ligase-like ATP-grasp enzyme
VDVFETKEGYKILEVNNGISMVHFAKASLENHEIALNIYEKYIVGSFKSA